MILRTVLLGCGLATLGLSSAMAAPFCVQMTGIPLQCLYIDPALCQKEALRNGGRCAVNPAEFVTPVTASQYCLVEAANVVACIYPDRADCDAESRRRGGACVAATPVPPPGPAFAPGVDPYELNRP